ncbi:flagellar hook-associated protein FlgK [Syntrophobotulus glycolicus DSM 8271]|uniref:Flagellar hook-associated protein 1 n=1 Tax=Syntrophobotulus glycolicus (strain DSM 8271 / FlGlyR) TaxID=645991 RepID=F0SZD6_SYNGF|nr:flagellar hook-associated protein FlgK [Syntrophobotulus glycolicus]ADY54941.1 flagellar hook-associated protein FlgK [Syntrophobotulus glycolicus DSM 8271]
MGSTFAGLELGKRALSAQQLALNAAGHNISNASTQGYTRQVANLATTIPDQLYLFGHTQSVGTGVAVATIIRVRDNFIDRQYRWETARQQYWTERQNSLQQVEGILNEDSADSLHNDLDKFWVAWSDLSTSSETLGAKAVVRERAIALTGTLNHISKQITDMQNDLDNKVNVQVGLINNIAQQIKDLNMQIKSAEVAGDKPNDLYDVRDNLVDELSKIVSVRVIESTDPMFTDRQVGIYKVQIGDEAAGQLLVDDSQVTELAWIDSVTNTTQDLDTTPDGIPDVEFGPGSGIKLQLGSQMGSLQSLIDTRYTYLQNLQGKLDNLAAGIVTAVNSLHQDTDPATTDYFFDPTKLTASDITLYSDIEDDAGRIITGTTGSGDGDVASSIAALAHGWSSAATPAEMGSAASLGDYYNGNIVAVFGVDVQQAQRMTAVEDALINQLSNRRDSVSGVSIDEEMTNLIKFQTAYSAAARMVTIMDDMLDKVVNGMGITR